MKLRFLTCLASISMISTPANAETIESDEDTTIKHAHDLGYATGEYHKTAYYCNYFGLYSDAEYFAHRKIIVTLNTKLVGAKDAFIFADSLEKQMADKFSRESTVMEEIMPPGMTTEQMRAGCDAMMTDWDHKIGVLRAKLDLFE